MSNFLKMDFVNAVRALKERKWSQRKIARELGIDRGTVAKYFKHLEGPKPVSSVEAEEANSKPATNSTPGSSSSEAEQNPPISTLGNLVVQEAVERVYGRPGPASKCQEHAEQIRAKVEIGLTAQRIYQDLIAEVQFTGSYQSVKRFIRRLQAASPTPVCRMEVQPGEEAQVDFGSGATILGENGRKRRP